MRNQMRTTLIDREERVKKSVHVILMDRELSHD